MFTLFGIGFTAPWLLLALGALPILWLLLRAVPPAPIRRLFPGVILLLGLRDDETQSDRTPWWLLLLRLLAIAALILGFAGPVLNPREGQRSTAPVLVLADGSWADAPDWSARLDRIGSLLADAARADRPVLVSTLTEPFAQGAAFLAAEAWRPRLAGLKPAPWRPDAAAVLAALAEVPGGHDTIWLSDGLAFDGRDAVLQALQDRGDVRIIEAGRPVLALRPARFEDGAVLLEVARTGGGSQVLTLAGHGLDPAGIERELVNTPLAIEAGATVGEAALSLQPELRNRMTRFAITGQRSAGAVALTDDSLQRREVGLVSARDDREGLELLSPLHYLEQALQPTADLVTGRLIDIVQANPDAIILADVATLSTGEAAAVGAWVEKGGLLVRFAGPRLAASDVSRETEDRLLPVRLRAGGRTVGGAMSWGEPKALRPFAESSPFFGLAIPDDVVVSAQVLAQPDPQLAERVIAALADGTPLVTRKPLGEGQVVLFHVAANAEWSSLPLSGLFVQMLDRLAVSTQPLRPEAAELAGTIWVPVRTIDAFGAVSQAEDRPGVDGALLAGGATGPDLWPGLYAGEDRRIAMNAVGAETAIEPAAWPAGTAIEGLRFARETELASLLHSLALLALALDIVASLWLSGRLRAVTGRAGTAALVLGVGLALVPGTAGRLMAQDDSFALAATESTVLAHVVTGDAEIDRIAQAGLMGLSDVLFARTSIEPGNPIAIDLETDELSLFPFLYWPITPTQPLPSVEAYERLNGYLRAGGMILFDTRDADLAGFGAASPNGRKLQQLAAELDVPALEPLPPDHVLTRTFYLLQDFPGRHAGREIWLEASPSNAELAEGMPFRNLNDNVTPVVIGGNDWAAAWAVDSSGNWMFPVGRGLGGERQRELAYRFGVNLVMYVLTGNYKSDQVHVPALLDRLGQ